MPRKKALPDQYTASLHLLCPGSDCSHEFVKEQAWLKRNHSIFCPRCGRIIAANDEEIFRLRSQQVKNIVDAVDLMRRQAAKEPE